MSNRLPILALCAGLGACASPAVESTSGGASRSAGTRGEAVPTATWQAPPLARALSIRDGRDGHELSLERMLDELATYDAVFLGETHTDETTHRVELAVYEGLLERRGGSVVLAMEMFERDVQSALDEYLAGRIDESEFLDRARPWSNYPSAYRPLIERARIAGAPALASNFPRPLRGRVAREGREGLEALRAESPDQVPRRLEANTDAYWKRVDNAVRGHLAMMGGGNQGPEERLYSTQSLWDNSMGETCSLALADHPDHMVLHVNGGFHSQYWDGTVHQFMLRSPDARVATVSILPTSNPSVSEFDGAPWADYVVFAESRATDVHDGRWSVSVPGDVYYRLHIPDGLTGTGATAENPVPLLVWLGGDGLLAQAGLDLWRERLGDECAIAVLDAPYRETQEDLAAGGRWYWPDSFSSDVGRLRTAVERSASYLVRNYPIDPDRICVAGEGTGATVVAALSLLSDRLALRGVAFEPRRYSKIRDFPLPLAEERGDSSRPGSLQLTASGATRDWWESEFAQYAGVGFECSLVESSEDPWLTDWTQERILREALGLELPPMSDDVARRHIVIEGRRAHFWARLHGLGHFARTGERVAVLDGAPSDGDSLEISVELGPESFGEDRRPPRCPGPFGGTTVLVLPATADEAAAQAWLELEENDPLAAKSRFHRTRIATLGGERDLAAVLARLIEEGRTNVLVVPAVFCADGETMRALRAKAHGLDDSLTLHWRPGLGGLD